MSRAGLAIVGAGAAGLMAGTFAAREAGKNARIVLLDGAARLGAKILVAGGGRCNVTHERVDERDFAGSTPAAIRRVLQRFTVADTVAFFAAQGVRLAREETGKLFPVSNRARDVLDALVRAATEAGAQIRPACRVATVARDGDGFELAGPWGSLRAERIVLATGGMSLPKSGSDGAGFALARALGHGTTPRILPALVPLTLTPGDPLRELAGVTVEAALEVRAAGGRRLLRRTGSMLFAHFGITGPLVLDVSRHYLDARAQDPGARVVLSLVPREDAAALERSLLALGRASVGRFLRERLPERLAETVARVAAVDPATAGHALTRDGRRALLARLTEWPLEIDGHRGFVHAEATAGGVPLAEVRLDTLFSRVCPGLSLCGEILDVDGRIGGFNFQWAWASGFVAGTAAGRSLTGRAPGPTLGREV